VPPAHFAIVVEDDEDTYELYSEVLASAGYSVLGANNGIEAVTADEIHTLARELFEPTRIALTVLGPISDQAEALRGAPLAQPAAPRRCRGGAAGRRRRRGTAARRAHRECGDRSGAAR